MIFRLPIARLEKIGDRAKKILSKTLPNFSAQAGLLLTILDSWGSQVEMKKSPFLREKRGFWPKNQRVEEGIRTPDPQNHNCIFQCPELPEYLFLWQKGA